MNSNKRSRRYFFPFIFFFVCLSFTANGGIVFSDLDLSNDNQLLFRGGSASQDALFLARLPGPGGSASYTLQQLTAFPEKIDLLDNGRLLQIRNAFGSVRIPVSGGLPVPIPGFPSFAGGNPLASGRSEEMSSSGDGRWFLYLDPLSPALGDLIMVDVLSGTKTLVASRLDRPEKLFPAVWSPDSRFFVYERGGKLYYYMNGSLPSPAEERTRFIGEGYINSVSWGSSGDFYYLRGSTLFRVRRAELATRSLYVNFLEIGVIAGRIPFEFDPCFDNFWIAPDGRSLLVSKGRRSLFFYPLGTDNTAGAFEAAPYLLLPRSSSGISVLWAADGTATVLVSIPEGNLGSFEPRRQVPEGNLFNFVPGSIEPRRQAQEHIGAQVRVWRLKFPERGGGASFESLLPPNLGAGSGSFPNGSLSPDGKLVLFWGAGGILLYDYLLWKPIDILSLRPGTACVWNGINDLIIADEQKIERIRLTLPPETAGPLDGGMPGNSETLWNYRISRRELICLSQVIQAGFEENTLRVLAKSGDAWYVTNGRSPWVLVLNPRLKNSSQVSPQYRVYLEKQGQGFYENLPFIRNITSVGTFSLFPSGSGIFPSQVASAGIWAGNRELALCFDLYDDDQGLPEVLDALNRFGIRATFFLNGEFIRRQPLAVMDIVSAGHETASMFFSLIDLSDARYQAGPDFISRGLARNEDEFYRVTGKELALLWHPPWYNISPDIAAAAARIGYITSGRDIDPLDWVSREEEKRLGLIQKSSSEMIDRIMEMVKPGSIIPVRLGLLPGGRNDYLFNRINVLLDALIREGYTLTTVQTLIEHAR